MGPMLTRKNVLIWRLVPLITINGLISFALVAATCAKRGSVGDPCTTQLEIRNSFKVFFCFVLNGLCIVSSLSTRIDVMQTHKSREKQKQNPTNTHTYTHNDSLSLRFNLNRRIT